MNELETIQAARIQRLEKTLITLIVALKLHRLLSEQEAEKLGEMLKGDGS